MFNYLLIAEKKHEPMFINPSYQGSRREGLTTWSPYRAADEVTLISMPKTVVRNYFEQKSIIGIMSAISVDNTYTIKNWPKLKLPSFVCKVEIH